MCMYVTLPDHTVPHPCPCLSLSHRRLYKYLDLDELGFLRDVPSSSSHHLQHRVLQVLLLG